MPFPGSPCALACPLPLPSVAMRCAGGGRGAAAASRSRRDRAAPKRATRRSRSTIRADTGDVNYQTKVGTLTGNVIITQGTLTIHADKIVFKQNPDNSMSASGVRQPGRVPPEARRRRRVFRRLRPARRVRRREAVSRTVRPRAAAPRPGRDPQQLHHLQRRRPRCSRPRAGRRARRRADRSRPRRARARRVPAEVRCAGSRKGATPESGKGRRRTPARPHPRPPRPTARR